MIDELGIYLLPGRIKDPARALDEAAQAEALGLSVAWLAERYDIKDMGVLCGAIAARTSTIKVGMGSVAAGTRAPIMTAAMTATMQQTFGDRCVLGVARGLDDVTTPHGLPKYSMAMLEDYLNILKQLWAGESVDYDGPVGRIPNARLVDPLTEPPPTLLFCSWVPGPVGAAIAARCADGVFLGSELTVDAHRRIRAQLDEACEREGRDPKTLKLYTIVITAPDMNEEDELLVVNARVLTHLGFAGVGEHIMRINEWDPSVMKKLTAELEGADQKFHRSQLMEMAAGLPREWITEGNVVGSASECCRRLREYLDAGVDHIVLHGSNPEQLAGMVETWKETA